MGSKTRQYLCVLGAALSLLPALVRVCYAAGLDGVAVMALSPADGSAVVKLESGRMQVVKAGAAIEGMGVTLVQVLPDKLVLEEVSEENGNKTKTTVWLYKAQHGVSQLQRLERQAPVTPIEMLKVETIGGNKPR
ncbi:MAG TPA: hypothetical protein VFX02_12735 [Gammaproteobacteria bacterium]|nr:hypothetical protein [Gammaproteobacteria bacterium]